MGGMISFVTMLYFAEKWGIKKWAKMAKSACLCLLKNSIPAVSRISYSYQRLSTIWCQKGAEGVGSSLCEWEWSL